MLESINFPVNRRARSQRSAFGRAYFRGPGGGGPGKLFLHDLIKEFAARVNKPPQQSDFLDPFLFRIATEVYASGKRAVAALGTALQMKAYFTGTQEATHFDKFNFLMDNTMGKDPPHLETLMHEGLDTSCAFQRALHDERFAYAHIPDYVRPLIPKKIPLSLNFSAFNVQYYLFALDRAFSLQNQNMGEALLWLKVAILLSPALYIAYLESGFIYTQMQDYKRALEMHERLLSVMPDNAAGYFQRGASYGSLGEFAKAEADFAKALELKPDFRVAKFNLLGAQMKQGKVVDVFGEMLKLADDFPPGQRAPVYSNISHLFCMQGDFEQAIIFSQKAVEDDPSLPEGHYNGSVALANLCRYEEALEKCEACLSLAPDMEAAWLHKAYVLYYLNRIDQAILWCRNTIFNGKSVTDENILDFLKASRTNAVH